ncbi:MAG: methyl-accepting chemotaxis protein, partial [Pseudohongiella sp.]
DMLDTVIAPAARAVTDLIEQLVAFQVNRIDEAAYETDAYYAQSRNTSIVAMLAIVLVVTLAAWQLTISIVRPIRSAVQAAKQIADNDLTAKITVDGDDEATVLLRAIEQMQTNLKQAMDRISTSTDQLASSSEELSAVTDETNNNLQQQSEQLTLAASAVTELTYAIEEVASNASETARVSADTEEQTSIGLDQVKKTVSAIESLMTDIQENAGNTDTLAARVEDVGAVLDVIRSIAEQTNLLALNAAIEAARAGEHGRGFAVVADEVRGLAGRTAESTKEIEEIIKAIRDGSKEAVLSMKESQQSASDTLAVGLRAGEALEKIAGYISTISDRNTSSASSSEQQAQVAREVDRNLLALKELGEQTATGSRHTSQASQELARLAENLSGLVTQFKI